MFQLENAIRSWRSSFIESESISRAEVDELESHLTELISDLRQLGLDDHEAFLVATKRLGTARDLREEYAKVNSPSIWSNRMAWMLCGYVAFGIASAVISACSQGVAIGAALAGLGPGWIGACATLTLAIAWGVLLFRCYRQTKSNAPTTVQFSFGMGVFAVFGYVLSVAVSRIAMVPMAQISSSKDLGIFAIWQTIGGAVVHIGVVIACVLMMWHFAGAGKQSEELAA